MFFFKILKINLKLIYQKIRKFIDHLIFEKYINIYRNNKLIFKIKDMGYLTRFRAKTFESKEPETLEWIESFSKNDTLLDIGANIGLYSLYAAYLGHKVISIEPDSLNFALLNLNVMKNSLSSKINSYGIAINNIQKFSTLNISSFKWGGALSSFDNHLNYQGKEFKSEFNQGVFGITLDDFLQSTKFKANHIKIDVDGNEFLILKGGIKTLKNNRFKSLLIELDENHPKYKKSIEIIESSGLRLIKKTNQKTSKDFQFQNSYNHIFMRKKL